MFANLANKRKLDEATSARDDVSPVYLLEELWQIVQNGGPETAAGFVEYLNKRLSAKSPVVKQKALRVIKFLCGKGSSDFKRNISKHAGAVRELQHYRGEPDPFKGDVPNQKVRDMAKEAMDAMFAPTEAPSYSSASATSFNTRIKGFGSSQDSNGFSVAPTNSKPSGMMGFGNPRYGSQASSSISSGSRFGRGGYEAPGETSGRNEGSFSSMIQRVGSGALSPKAIMDSITAKGNEFLQGRRGPGILNNDDQTGYSSDEADRGYEKPHVNGAAGNASSLGPRRADNGGSADGSEESRLVNHLCTPGGLRAQPTREDLAIFIESAGGLSGDLIAERLAEKMESTSWQASLRALCALEAVVQHGSTAACGGIAVHFQSNPAALESAAGSPQASVRQRASRVLQLLGVTSAAPISAPAGASSAPDLLGGLEDNSAAQTATGSASQQDLLGDLMDPPSTSAAPAAADIFSGLSTAQPSAVRGDASRTPAAGDLFQGLETGATRQSTSGAASDDLFGGLATTRTAQASSASNSLGDLMSGVPAPAASAAAAEKRFFEAPAISAGVSGELADIFSGLSTSSASPAVLSQQPARQPTPQQLAAQRTASLGKADPLSSLTGLPQGQQAPMGQGISAQRGASPTLPMSGMGVQPQGFPDMQGGGFASQQLTPQQMQYLRQLQYMQFMQMQARAMGRGGSPTQQASGAFPAQPQTPGFGGMQHAAAFQQPQFAPTSLSAGAIFAAGNQNPHAGDRASGMGGGPISLDALSGGGQGQPISGNTSSSLGITQQSDFDFVGDHVRSLRGKK